MKARKRALDCDVDLGDQVDRALLVDLQVVLAERGELDAPGLEHGLDGGGQVDRVWFHSMSNPEPYSIFDLAASFVLHTDRDLFITGKAGTGKTTFLKYIREHSPKKTVVVAPTGVAAINAEGVTIHSFFQLPFGSFLPGRQRGLQQRPSTGTDLHTLLANQRFNKEKSQLFQELEMLIIDEVSMLRADMLDAMDGILRHFRKKPHVPFGGVQVVYIGDLYQLPPVVKDEEWEMLQLITEACSSSMRW